MDTHTLFTNKEKQLLSENGWQVGAYSAYHTDGVKIINHPILVSRHVWISDEGPDSDAGHWSDGDTYHTVLGAMEL